ncbi:MAG: aminoglycoside phosphotransferase family protein [Mycobacterium sp.]|uniref:phosphotransferase family protein n=3 Tax=Mycobacterium sp. TaxID=1785 RepID=UPI003C7787D4
MTLPTHPSQITAAWLGSVLGVDISSVSVEAIGTGQTAATYRIIPTYRQPSDSPPSFIAKLPSQHQDVRERVALGYRAEHAFYTRVADTVSIPLPQVYHCDIASDGSEFVLLLSDLDPAVQGDQIRGCDKAEARLAVEALAGLHGPRWCDPAWLSFDGVTMPKADSDIARGMGQLAHTALDTTLSGIGHRISAQDRSTLTESADVVERWLGINPERFCLLHGDYRLDNLLFDPDKRSVTVVDWQTITVGLPTRDLAYFLGTSLDSDLREAREPELVNAYHRRLLDYGVTDYSAADCWNDYRIGMLQVPLLTTFGYAFAAATDRGDEMVLVMLTRGCRAIRHLQTTELIRKLA